MASLFRKSSVEKLQNPDQLDKAIVISSPLSWLALVGIALMIAATLIWSVVGTLPTTQTVTGLIVNPVNTCAVYSEQSGSVEKLLVSVGDELQEGTEVAEVRLADGSMYRVKATQPGTVSELLIDPDTAESENAMLYGDTTKVYPGSEIIRYTPAVNASQTVILYVSYGMEKQLKKGMKVMVTPVSADSQSCGHMEAEIVNIGEYPVSANNLSYVLGESDNYLSSQFTQSGALASVICELKTDSSTVSGFYWSGKDGAGQKILNGTVVSAKIVVEECAPIGKLITGLKDGLEG